MDELPPLPDPLDYCYEWDGPYGSRKFSAALHNGMPPDRSVAIYTADQMRAYAAAAVAKERYKWELLSNQVLTDAEAQGVLPEWHGPLAAAIRGG